MAKKLIPIPNPKGDGCQQAKVNAFPLTAKRFGDDVRGLQSAMQEELDALLPSMLDRVFRREL